MRNPEKVLNSLINHSKDKNYKFERLYRILYNKDMYLLAYQNIYAHEGNMTKGTDGETIDGMSLKRIDDLITKCVMKVISRSRPEEYISRKKTAKGKDRWGFLHSLINWCRKLSE